MVVSGSVHSITSTSPAAILRQQLAGLERRQRALQPAHIDLGIPDFGCLDARSLGLEFRHELSLLARDRPTLDTPAISRQVPHMVADSEIQRIARLTPLADVLASFDLSVGPVAPREEALAAALGLTLAADVVIDGRPSQGCACAARRLSRCGRTRRSTPRPTRRRRSSPRAAAHRHRRSRCPPPPTRWRRSTPCRCAATGRGAGRGRARRRRAAARRRRRGRRSRSGSPARRFVRSTWRCCRRSASSASRCASRACAWCAPARATIIRGAATLIALAIDSESGRADRRRP